MGVGRDDKPGPAVRGGRVAQFGAGPAEGLLEHAQGVLSHPPVGHLKMTVRRTLGPILRVSALLQLVDLVDLLRGRVGQVGDQSRCREVTANPPMPDVGGVGQRLPGGRGPAVGDVGDPGRDEQGRLG
jgi:hypothetical protein